MKPAVAKKVKDIRGRAKSLMSSFSSQVKATDLKPEQLTDPDQRSVPRVTGLVIREGVWICKLAERLVLKSDTEIDKADDENLKAATEYFKEMAEIHSEEVSRNLFIDSLDALFIKHLGNMVLLVGKIDAQNQAQIAKVASLDDNLDFEDDEADEEVASRARIAKANAKKKAQAKAAQAEEAEDGDIQDEIAAAMTS